MATKRNNGLPLQLNPNLSTDLKKRVDNMNQDVQNGKQNSNQPDGTSVKQGTNPQTKPAKKLNAPNMNPGRNSYADPGFLKPQKKTPAKSDSAQRIENAINSPKKSNTIGKSVSGSLAKGNNKTNGGKPTEKSFTKSKKNVSNKNLKDNNTKKTLKKAFDAVAVMKERRAKAMANRDPKKNPNNINLRGIVKKGRKG